MPKKAIKKTTRKAAPKTAPTKTLLPNLSNRRIPVASFVIAAIVLAVVLLIGLFKNQFVVATVNGESISRIQLISELEKRQGKEALNNIVTEKLVMQEAKKKNVSVSEDEIKKQIEDIEKSLQTQGQKLDTLLAAQNVTREDLRKQVSLQVLLKKMVGSIQVTDKEITDFIDQNSGAMPEGTDPATLNTQVKQQLEQQKTGEKIQALVSELQQKAKIEYLLPL